MLTYYTPQKQKEELKRIHHMLDDLENDFMGSKENSTYIERYMEVRNGEQGCSRYITSRLSQSTLQ